MASSPELAPMDIDTAQRIAVMAVKPGGRTLVGPRVLTALLNRITELTLERAVMRRELDALAMRALEDARLRAHAMFVQQRGGADR